MGVETVTVGVAALPVGKLVDVGVPALTHDVEVWIFIHHGLAPLAHRDFLVVRVGVHTQAVLAGELGPPDRPLLEIFQHERIVEIHVRHRRHEPAADL